MAVQIQNALATTLVLRPSLRVVSTPTRLRVRDGFGSGRCGVSYQDYLSSSLCLPLDSQEALNTRKRKPLSINSTSNADSVVALFKEYGFSDAQLGKMFLTNPIPLTYDPEKVLRPKLNFIFRVGIPLASATEIVASIPFLLQRSLRCITLCFDLLSSLFAHDHRALASFLLTKRSNIFNRFSVANTRANVETLRSLGVPDSHIIKLTHVPSVLAVDSHYFAHNAIKVKDMGFDPQALSFVHGLRVHNSMSEEKWAAKADIFNKCFGWTDDQLVALFRKNYYIMASSEEKLKRSLDILLNRIGLTPHEITKYPGMLSCNFDRRILPRFSVLEILRSNGIINNMVLARAFMIPEGNFLDLFVKKHQNEFPELMELYAKTKGLKIED